MLNPSITIFKKVSKILKFELGHHYFASRLKNQVLTYVYYKPSPFAYLIDAFSVHWEVCKCYLFSL